MCPPAAICVGVAVLLAGGVEVLLAWGVAVLLSASEAELLARGVTVLLARGVAMIGTSLSLIGILSILPAEFTATTLMEYLVPLCSPVKL